MNENELMPNLRSYRDWSLNDFLIIEVEYSDDSIITYAIKKNLNNEWEWNEVKSNTIWKFSIISKLTNLDFEKLNNLRILEYYEKVVEDEKIKKLDEATWALFELYANIYKFDSVINRFPENEIIDKIQNKINNINNDNDIIFKINNILNNLNTQEQETVAIDFFKHTISDNIINNENNYKETEAFNDVYKIYQLYKETPFWKKFWNLINL